MQFRARPEQQLRIQCAGPDVNCLALLIVAPGENEALCVSDAAALSLHSPTTNSPPLELYMLAECTDAGAVPSKVQRRDDRSLPERLWEVTKEYLPLCLITFGGPPAHIALLHDRFVVQRKWLSETLFVELFAIGSALPGPASTQLAFSVALMREGIIAALWSFCIWRYVLCTLHQLAHVCLYLSRGSIILPLFYFMLPLLYVIAVCQEA